MQSNEKTKTVTTVTIRLQDLNRVLCSRYVHTLTTLLGLDLINGCPMISIECQANASAPQDTTAPTATIPAVFTTAVANLCVLGRLGAGSSKLGGSGTTRCSSSSSVRFRFKDVAWSSRAATACV